MLKRYFVRLSFKGTAYHGWQIQKNAVSVQSLVEKGLSLMLKSEINIVGCGRTDTGVHAKEYFAHFDFEKILDLKKRNDLVLKLNRFLPDDIVIHNIFPVENDTHARFSAVARTYKYFISTSKDPFNLDYSYFFHYQLDVDLMNKGAEILKETIDFTSFSKLHSQTKTNICQIVYAHWEEENGQLIFTIKADRFLRNMVRAIVGTLLDLGRNKINLNDLKKIILSKNRCDAGASVPASGLFLESIEYPENILVKE